MSHQQSQSQSRDRERERNAQIMQIEREDHRGLNVEA